MIYSRKSLGRPTQDGRWLLPCEGHRSHQPQQVVVRVDGERLEGVGVTPTIEVQAGAASAGSDDPQLSRAVAVLSGT